MTRAMAEKTIANLWGLPGTGHDTEKGRLMLLATIEHLGFAALSDAAVLELSLRHTREDERLTRLAQVS